MSQLDTIWWQVFALGACGAPIREGHSPLTATGELSDATPGEHRLRALDPWLDYLIELGANGLLLTPIFASVSHGYDTLDHFRLDPRLGDNADITHLIEEAHRRGIRVLFDGVFNHISRSHPQLEELGLRTENGDFHTWEGHGDLITLDHSSPRVRELVREVMEFWLERGIDGWRLDVAYAVPTDFWAEVLGKVRERFPEALFLGEVIHGDYPDFVARSSVDTLTQYELWASIRQSIAARNFWELDWNLGRHAQFCEHFIPNTFIGNHDVERIATAVGPAGAVLAAAVLFTVPGMPSIYYGDEQGFTGTKLEGFSADDQLRPPLPERPEQLSDLGAGIYSAYRALIALRRTHPWLTRARLEVTGKDNTWIEYRVWEREHDDAAPGGVDSGQPAELRVRLDLEPHPRVRITGVAAGTAGASATGDSNSGAGDATTTAGNPGGEVELFFWHADAESGE